MKEIETVSGVPRSTIHYYLREGILPAAQKSARNAAIYDQRHLDRLIAIDRLKKRREHLPLGLLKRAAELMDRGVEPEVAVELERAVVGGAYVSGSSKRYSETTLAKAAGVSVGDIREMVRSKLLVPIPGSADLPDQIFDETDLRLVQGVHPPLAAIGFDFSVVTYISETIRDLSRYEMALRNQAVADQEEKVAFDLTRRIQEAVNLLHKYLFYRWRLHDIQELKQRESASSKGDLS